MSYKTYKNNIRKPSKYFPNVKSESGAQTDAGAHGQEAGFVEDGKRQAQGRKPETAPLDADDAERDPNREVNR